jgi:hypothetical protein
MPLAPEDADAKARLAVIQLHGGGYRLVWVVRIKLHLAAPFADRASVRYLRRVNECVASGLLRRISRARSNVIGVTVAAIPERRRDEVSGHAYLLGQSVSQLIGNHRGAGRRTQGLRCRVFSIRSKRTPSSRNTEMSCTISMRTITTNAIDPAQPPSGFCCDSI